MTRWRIGLLVAMEPQWAAAQVLEVAYGTGHGTAEGIKHLQKQLRALTRTKPDGPTFAVQEHPDTAALGL